MAREILDRKSRNSLPRGFGSRPWLFQLHGNEKQACTFIDPLNNSMEERILPVLQGKVCLGCYGEWLLVADELTKECFFLGIISFSKIYIPSFPDSTDFFDVNACITSPPNTCSCTVILTYCSKTFLLVCSPDRKRWNKVPLRYFDKNITDSLGGASVIHNDQLFVETTMGETLAIDVAPLVRGCVKMTIIDYLRPCPLPYEWYSCLVKSAGNLFSIFVHSYGSGQLTTHVEVHRLESSSEEMHWRRVQDIGHHAFFLAGQYGRSVLANKAWGVQRNCIYFPEDYDDGVRLYKFCLDNQVLSFTFLPDFNGGLDRLQWAFPIKKMQPAEQDACNSSHVVRSQETNSTLIDKEDGHNKVVISRRWDDLPIELVELLFQRLSLVDCLRLRSVCKGWSKASGFIGKGRVWPWLMHLPNLKYQACKFFDPFYGEEYTLKSNAVVIAHDHLALWFSKDGWVVVTEGNKKLFLLNPFTSQVINLPPVPLEDCNFDGISFMSMPTSPDFVIYGFFFQICGAFVEISLWRPGEKEWTILQFESSIPFFPSSNNPVLFRGEFYCLGRKGELGIFNPELETWNVLSIPAPIHLIEPEYGDEYCHLLELNGDLISIFRTDDTKSPINVFKLDQSAMVWINLELLGNITIFVDYRKSIAIPSPEKKYANRIYVTRFEGGSDSKKVIFYSMEDKKYHPSLHRVEEPVTCVWMEPNLQIRK